MNVQGKKITILGAARSGIAAALMLAEHGAEVFISDSAQPEKISVNTEILDKNNIEYEFGGHSHRVFKTSCVVLSPGIPVASSIVQSFFKKNIPVYSEVEAAWWCNHSPLIGVTGSNGKTTTTTLIGEMLRTTDEKAIVAGNIGQAFSEFIKDSNEDRWGVVELSSFQLETIDKFKPDIAMVLNFAPNHLDRYDSYKDYLKAKWRITKNLTSKDTLIFNGDDTALSEWAGKINAKKLIFKINSENPEGAGYKNDALFLFGEKMIDVSEIALKGVHNYMNAMAASLAAYTAGINKEQICHVLKNFKGVEHRLEKVAVINGVTFINDSKATTVESLFFALQSFKDPIVLIAGGKDKGSDFSRLKDLIKTNVKEVVLIGSAAEKIAATWKGVKPLHIEKSLKDAIDKARQIAVKNDVVLLSPACASFDMFTDYEDRGRQFKKLVQGLT